jgi:hypothetical protein
MKTKISFTLAAFFFVLIATPAFAITRWVGECGSSPNYNTIQDAVDDAIPYDLIIVCQKAGCYDEHVLITGNIDGLTIESQEIPNCGPDTCVNSFTIGFAPHSDHPENVTIKGFTVNVCKSNGVGIESSTNYNTIAFNHVYGCVEQFAGAGAAIRVNAGNVGNIIHHNRIDECSGTTSGISTEISGTDHNIHHNCVIGCKENGIWMQSDYSQIHQDQITDHTLRGIRISGDYNHVHQNQVCDGAASSVNLDGGTTGNYIHHNILAGVINGSTSGDRIRQNNTNADCPFESCDACSGNEQ